MKCDIHSGVLLKPDAILETRGVSYKHFYDCLQSLKAILLGNKCLPYEFQLPDSLFSYNGSLRQIYERSLTEESFSLEIKDKPEIIHSIDLLMLKILESNQKYSIPEIIEHLIYLFYFRIEKRYDFVFDKTDCEKLYFEIENKSPLLFNEIKEYLVGKMCRVYLLSGNQSFTAIEYIKTFVRYFFKYKPHEMHLLENYIHSLNKQESIYFMDKKSYNL